MFYGYLLASGVNKLCVAESTNLSHNILSMKLSANHYFLSSKVSDQGTVFYLQSKTVNSEFTLRLLLFF